MACYPDHRLKPEHVVSKASQKAVVRGAEGGSQWSMQDKECCQEHAADSWDLYTEGGFGIMTAVRSMLQTQLKGAYWIHGCMSGYILH